jgi:hypothetical protein
MAPFIRQSRPPKLSLPEDYSAGTLRTIGATLPEPREGSATASDEKVVSAEQPAMWARSQIDDTYRNDYEL